MMPKSPESGNPTVGFQYAFFGKKCILTNFWEAFSGAVAQVPRQQRVAGLKKSSRLYDSAVFRGGGPGGGFPRNPLRTNRMGGKNAPRRNPRFSVKMNAAHF
jgi:hypothetical protein